MRGRKRQPPQAAGSRPPGRPRAFGQEVFSAIAASSTPIDAARLLGCSAASIHHHAKHDGELRRALENQRRAFEDSLAEALLRHHGVITRVAKEFDTDPPAIRYHITRSARLLEVLRDAREGIVDTAEDNVFRAVEEGDLQYSWKLMQTLGKDRGYTERHEVDALVTHTVEEVSTESLVQMLNRLAGEYPEAVEADFKQLTQEERSVLSEALAAAQQQEAAG